MYKRVLLKLSGELFAGKKEFGISVEAVSYLASEVKSVAQKGIRIGVVLGGGNIFRGMAGSENGVERNTGDMIGMLATVINSLMLKAELEKQGVKCCVMTSVEMKKTAEYFTEENAKSHLDDGRVVIFAGGTGNPFFTTDTAAALRCAEIKGDLLIKATKVDGIYTKDPVKYSDAEKIERMSHDEALRKGIKVMDSCAFSLCKDNNIPIRVIEVMKRGNLKKCVDGESVGSLVTKGE